MEDDKMGKNQPSPEEKYFFVASIPFSQRRILGICDKSPLTKAERLGRPSGKTERLRQESNLRTPKGMD
jgi:hypothetical protein